MVYPARTIDYLWELEIVLWVIVVIVIYQLGYYFLKRYREGPVESKPFNFGMCLFMFAFATARLIENMRGYYIAFEYSLGYYDVVLTNFQITGINLVMRLSYYIIAWFGLAVISYIIEKNILSELGYNVRHYFTILAIIAGTLSILLYFNMVWIFPAMIIAVFMYFGSTIGFFFFFGLRSEAKLRNSFLCVAIGFLFCVIGIFASLPESYYVIGDFIMSIEVFAHLGAPFVLISGLIIVSKGFQLELFKWYQKIQHLYVIMPSGICIYNYNFKSIEQDQDLAASALTGISAIIQEITKSETRLKTIQQEQAILLLEYGENVTVALQTEENLSVLRNKLKIFTAEFETFFEDVFPIWIGDTNAFLPGKVLVDRIFSLSRSD